MKFPLIAQVAALLLTGAVMSARADINVGVTLSLTGPGASLGIPSHNAVKLFPRDINGEKINYVVLDDASDPSTALRNLQKLSDDNRADVIIGSSITPATLAMVDAAGERKLPLLSLAASARIVLPQDANRRWVFKAISNESLVAAVTVDNMLANKVKTLGFIGFSDPYGESWLNEIKAAAEPAGIKIVAVERYARNDTSVIGQAVKLLSAKPDAIMIAGAGTPAALPQKTLVERGYKGPIYQTYGIANNDFLKVAGKDAEGAVFAAGGVVVANQLDPSNPTRPIAMGEIQAYENAYGKGSMNIFAANTIDTNLLLRKALPAALAKAKPGTAEFRAALRDALEQVRELVTTQGIINMTPEDHVGYDKRAVVAIQVKNGAWRYVK